MQSYPRMRRSGADLGETRTVDGAKKRGGDDVVPRVLVAHPDAALRAQIAEALRADRHAVVEASSDDELLDYLGRYFLSGVAGPPPDVVVAGVAPAGSRGFETLVALRKMHAKIPVVLVAERDAGSPDSFDANSVFFRPFDMDDLRTIVLNLVPADAWLRYRWAR
jgi:DNA-binding response OmpR family regulator